MLLLHRRKWNFAIITATAIIWELKLLGWSYPSYSWQKNWSNKQGIKGMDKESHLQRWHDVHMGQIGLESYPDFFVRVAICVASHGFTGGLCGLKNSIVAWNGMRMEFWLLGQQTQIIICSTPWTSNMVFFFSASAQIDSLQYVWFGDFLITTKYYTQAQLSLVEEVSCSFSHSKFHFATPRSWYDLRPRGP